MAALSIPPSPGPSLCITTLIPTGLKRGIVVFLHGLTVNATYPVTITNGTGVATGLAEFLTVSQNLQADGWVVVGVVFPEDGFASGNPMQGIWNDVNTGGSSGTRYLNTVLSWWDVLVDSLGWIYGKGLPLVPFGVSGGGWKSIQIASNRTSTISAYGADITLTAWPAVSPTFVPNPSFMQSPITTTLNGATSIPLSNGTLPCNTNPITAGFTSSGWCVVVSGPQNWNIFNYTGLTASSFTGVNGGLSGTLSNGATIEQSTFTSNMDLSFTQLNSVTGPPGVIGWETGDIAVGYANQQQLFNTASGAGANVTSYPTSGGVHTFSNADAAFYAATTYNNGTTYTANQIVISGGNAYICIATTTGNTPPNASFWTLIGAQAAQGWFATTVDPLCPRTH